MWMFEQNCVDSPLTVGIAYFSCKSSLHYLSLLATPQAIPGSLSHNLKVPQDLELSQSPMGALSLPLHCSAQQEVKQLGCANLASESKCGIEHSPPKNTPSLFIHRLL